MTPSPFEIWVGHDGSTANLAETTCLDRPQSAGSRTDAGNRVPIRGWFRSAGKAVVSSGAETEAYHGRRLYDEGVTSGYSGGQHHIRWPMAARLHPHPMRHHKFDVAGETVQIQV